MTNTTIVYKLLIGQSVSMLASRAFPFRVSIFKDSNTRHVIPQFTNITGMWNMSISTFMASASVNFRDFEVFLFLFGRTKQAQIFLETTLEDINFHLRAFCDNSLYNCGANRL